VTDVDQPAPVRDRRHQELTALIGKWINEGHTIGSGEIPPVPILTSDVYEWAPGGFFVVHSAFGRIGETAVGGVEIIGVDGDAYRSTFYDSFGNVHRSRLEIHQPPTKPAPGPTHATTDCPQHTRTSSHGH
jgi:hypothetical protein